MFTNIQIENYEGINKKIDLDFISKGRNRNNFNCYSNVDNRISINRIIGILGSNSTGKTSIISAIGFIGSFLETPILLDSIIDSIRKVDENSNLSDNEKEDWKKKLNIIKDGPSFQNQNIDSGNKDTFLSVEMYINTKNDFTGFYKYSLKYSGEYNMVLREELEYKKSFKSLYKNIVSSQQDTKSKVGDLYRNYKNLKDMNANLSNIDEKSVLFKYIEVFIKHYLRDSKICSADSFENIDEDDFIKELDSDEKISFYSNILNMIDTRLDKFKLDNNNIYIINNKGNKLKFRYLSDGTLRCLTILCYMIEIVKNGGILVIDELELNLSMDLIKLLINIFINSSSESQLIFTTNISQIFDVEDIEGKYIFKQDMVQLLYTDDNENANIKKLLDYRDENGARIKNLQAFCKKYSENKMKLGFSNYKIEKVLNSSKNIQNF